MNKKKIKYLTHFFKPFLILTFRKHFIKTPQRMILLYHGISKKQQSNCITQDLFKEQIHYLKEKYLVVPLHTLVEKLEFPTETEKELASITFDDGYVNFSELALPVLEECGCHATVFVPSGKVGHYNDWDYKNGSFHKTYIMSYQQLRQLPEKVVEIGSHGILHRPLDRLSPNQVSREIVESRLEIEQGIGKPVRFFAFPYGVYPIGCGLNFYENGKRLLGSYLAACTTWWGRYNSIRDVYALRRIGIWETDSFKDFLDKLRGDYDWLIIKEKISRFYKYVTLMQKQ